MNAVAEVEHDDITSSKPNVEIVSRYPRIQNMIRADPMGVGMLAMMALEPFGKDVEKIFPKSVCAQCDGCSFC
jgi:hypothetical protein